MTRLSWNAADKRYFEAGVDRGVLYLKNGVSAAWDGLVSVSENGGDAAKAYYLDGRPYLYLPMAKEFSATISAYTYPDEFAYVMGVAEADELAGFYLDSQVGDTFGLSYRTKVGNGTEGIDHGYKIHLIYNASVAAPAASYETLSQDVNPSTFSWDINAAPMPIVGYRSTAHVVIDTRKMSPALIADVETLLYGDTITNPELPDPFVLMEMLRFGDSIIITDNGDGTWTAKGATVNVFSVDSKTFQVDNVIAVDNGDGTFDISTTLSGGTESVQTITLSEAARIENNSITAGTAEAGYLLLTSAGGADYNAGPVGQPLPSDDISPSVMITLPATMDMAQRTVMIPDWHCSSDSATKLPNPTALPTAATQGGTYWSPDGNYFAVTPGASPYLEWYKRVRDVFTKLVSPATPPAGTVASAAWSPDGQYLATAHTTTPFVTIYKRSGDTLTKLTNPTVLPGTQGRSVSWSPNGLYLAVGAATSPYLTVYKRSGDVFTKLSDPPSIPTSDTYDVAFSPNGTHLAVAMQGSPYLQIYKQSGDAFTLLPSLGITVDTRAVSWSPSGKYLLIGMNAGEYLSIYKRDGDSFAKLAAPDFLPTNTVSRFSWSPDERYVIAAMSGAPIYYMLQNDALSRLRDIVTTPPNGSTFKWSPDGSYLVAGHATTPYITIYKNPGNVAPGINVTLEIAT